MMVSSESKKPIVVLEDGGLDIATLLVYHKDRMVRPFGKIKAPLTRTENGLPHLINMRMKTEHTNHVTALVME